MGRSLEHIGANQYQTILGFVAVYTLRIDSNSALGFPLSVMVNVPFCMCAFLNSSIVFVADCWYEMIIHDRKCH